jgi:glycosyltransferase involved in cell wall biosynthesis
MSSGAANKAGRFNVVFLIRSLDRGGAETQLVALARGLAARMHEVTVIVLYPGGALEAELESSNVTIIRLGKTSRWSIAPALWGLARHLRSLHPDVIHGYLPTSNALAALMNVFVPGARIVFGVRASDVHLSRYDRFTRAQYLAESLLMPWADLVISNSTAELLRVRRRSRRLRGLVHIPNGIDTDRFRPDPAGRSRLRREWQVASDETLIGLVARLDPMKDHTTFLEAARIVVEARRGTRFVCVGGAPDRAYEARLRQHASALGLDGTVIWAGQRADMPAVYSALDLFTLTSAFGEGFPNVIGEAMACGVPCVVTDAGDAAEIVADADLVVPRGDAPALAAAWGRLLSRASPLTASAVRQRIVDEYSLDRLILTTEAQLQSLLDASG